MYQLTWIPTYLDTGFPVIGVLTFPGAEVNILPPDPPLQGAAARKVNTALWIADHFFPFPLLIPAIR
jgi:hypothetical protein